jgi:hypothetical protein
MKLVLKEFLWFLLWLGAGILLVPGFLWAVRQPFMTDPAAISLEALTTGYREMFARLDMITNWLWFLSPYVLFVVVRATVNSIKPREAEGYSRLALAVRDGDLDSIQSLLDNGADIDTGDMEGLTPLHLSARNNRVDVIRLLIEGGANIDAADPQAGMRALHIAAREGNRDVCEVLIRYGADIDALNLMGETALHNAVEHGHGDVVAILLKYRARPDLSDKNGRTPLQSAVANGNREIAGLIRQHVSDEWPYLQLSHG